MLPVLLIGTFASVISATPVSTHVLHEERDYVPAGWVRTAPLYRDAVLPVRVGLQQSNLDRGHDLLMDVSDPASLNYGKHWALEDIAAFFEPSEETKSAVLMWLHDAGVHRNRIQLSPSGGWYDFDATSAELEELLHTKYHIFTHETGKPHIACDHYSVPEHVSKHVDFITPTIHFDARVGDGQLEVNDERSSISTVEKRVTPIGGPKTRPFKLPSEGTEVAASTANCGTYIKPTCLRALYKIPIGTLSLSSFGIVEYSPETYEQADLNYFFDYNNGYLNDAGVPNGDAPTVDKIDGGYLDPDESPDYQGEPDLDLEYAMTLVYPQKVTLFQVGDQLGEASFNNFLDGIDSSYCTYQGGDNPNYDQIFPDPQGYNQKEACGKFAPSSVISTSYAYDEASLSVAYADRQCYEYMKLGLAGTSFLFSSGDYGVAGNGGYCLNTKGQVTTAKTGAFNPTFPSTCPYVTSVGATQLPKGASVTTAETACETVIYSGGGFSNKFNLPSYQSSAVASYFKNHKPTYTSAQYNTTQKSRGIPDVAANGANYIVVVDGELELVYGTSASAPTFASVIVLINNERLHAKKAVLGFLNPTFYANPTMFNDITSGGNQGCGTAGFTAVTGWDPVTGLGTPNYTKMLAVLG